MSAALAQFFPECFTGGIFCFWLRGWGQARGVVLPRHGGSAMPQHLR